MERWPRRYLIGSLALTAVAVVALVAVVFAVLGDEDEPAPTPEPTATTATSTATEQPTATPTEPSATAVPTATDTPPAPTATATQPSAATATPSPNPSTRVDHGPRGSGMVALTLDMGGRVEPALDIMNWLVANEVKATIFMTGAMADNPNTDAGRAVLGIVDEHPELFDLGNHSYSHPDFTQLSAGQMVDELRRTEMSIAQHTGIDPRPIWRPPFGAVNQAVLNAVGPAGYAYTVMWDIDTIDWKPVDEGGPTAEAIVAKVVENAQGGSIVLMHLGGYHTYEALPEIVAGLQAKGLMPVRLSDMLGY